jgi:hypothetical protein
LALRALLRQLFRKFGFAGSAPATLPKIWLCGLRSGNSSQKVGFVGSAPETLPGYYYIVVLTFIFPDAMMAQWSNLGGVSTS